MFCSYLIPLCSVDGDTPPVGAVVGIVISALVILTIVIVATVAVAVFAIWWNKKDSGTFNLQRYVSMECSKQAAYRTIARMFVYGTRCCLKLVYDDVVMYRTGYRIAEPTNLLLVWLRLVVL